MPLGSAPKLPFGVTASGTVFLGNNTGRAELDIEGTVAQGAVVIIEDEAGGIVDLDATTGTNFHASNAASACATFTTSGVVQTLTFFVNKAGYPVWVVHAAPADADLNAGDMALWFDQTPGASKLMVKVKDSGGTVRTGSLALV